MVYKLEKAIYHIHGRKKVRGTFSVQGAKNATLPIIAASLLAQTKQTVLYNVPLIRDVYIAIEIATFVGAKIDFYEDDHVLVIDASNINKSKLPVDLTEQLSGAILFLSSIMVRAGQVSIEKIGGCNIGKRTLDLHYSGFARLGAQVEINHNQVNIELHRHDGADIFFDRPSHTGTENLIIAACLANGTTTINNASLEPEVEDLTNFLISMGAKISGVGTGIIRIEGVKELSAVEYTIMPDRMDACSIAMITAATDGHVSLVGANPSHFGIIRTKLEQMGIEFQENGPFINIRRKSSFNPINVITWPYPGFATDLQPPLVALACLANGTSYIRETIFERRFSAIKELKRLGANIEIRDDKAIVYGPNNLIGSTVIAHDIRAGMALIIAGSVAKGETIIEEAQVIERGYSSIVQRLSDLGLDIKREVITSEIEDPGPA